MTYAQRVELKSLLYRGYSSAEIASSFGFSLSTIYREISRGNDGTGYNPDYSESRYQLHLREKGTEPLLSERPELAQYISNCILVDRMSPERISVSKMGWAKYAEDNMEINQDCWKMKDKFEEPTLVNSFPFQDINKTAHN